MSHTKFLVGYLKARDLYLEAYSGLACTREDAAEGWRFPSCIKIREHHYLHHHHHHSFHDNFHKECWRESLSSMGCMEKGKSILAEGQDIKIFNIAKIIIIVIIIIVIIIVIIVMTDIFHDIIIIIIINTGCTTWVTRCKDLQFHQNNHHHLWYISHMRTSMCWKIRACQYCCFGRH